MVQENLKIADKQFTSRLFLGTGKFGSPQLMQDAVNASSTELVTMALKRIDLKTKQDSILSYLQNTSANLLPNTSGVRTAKKPYLLHKPHARHYKQIG